MAILKCKMCGGDLDVEQDVTVCECEYCGTRQTVPNIDNEKKVTQFTRANRLRFGNEFDRAYSVYESIVAEFPDEAEAYWGLVLCKYGIEYVDDPATGKKIPTCHRSSFDSVLEDSNFEMVMEYADAASRSVYRGEAKAIETLRTGILEVSGKESPYDIFICYKETGADGGRTADSVLAQDIYDALTEKGYKVFFSRITLEDKAGQEYEPYIFAALNSAKLMLAVGTEYDHYHAVWVKNEWSRYLALIARGEKKILIPCYKDIDPYDMPTEFKKLQGYDLGKIGAMQDLLRMVDKLLGRGSYAQPQTQTVVQTSGPSSNSLIKRAHLFLEERNWEKVLEYCEQILDTDPESAETYWIQELAQKKCTNPDELIRYYYMHPSVESRALGYARRFADASMKQTLNYFDTGLQNFLGIQKASAAERAKARQNDPAAQKLKADIAKVRAQWKILEGRVCNDTDFTLALNEKGKAVVTKVTNDNYGIFAHGCQETTKWPKLASLTDAGSTIIGIDYSGRLRFTKDYEGKYDSSIPVEEMSQWTGIRQVQRGTIGYYGLKKDGTVVFAQSKDAKPEHDHGQGKISHLRGIKKIIAPYGSRLICLKEDGTLAATEYIGDEDKCPWEELSAWTDIVDVFGSSGRWIGLKKDGSLVATSFQGENPEQNDKWPEISLWTDIVRIFSGINGRRTYGLDAYGNLLATTQYPFVRKFDWEKEYDPWEKLSDWRGLVEFKSYSDFAVGLKYDGTLVTAQWFRENNNEKYDKGQAAVSHWTDVVYVDLGYGKTVAVKRDGTLLAAGDNEHGGCNVSGMKLFQSVDTLEADLKRLTEVATKEAEERERKIQQELELVRKDAAYEAYKAEIEKKVSKELEEKSAPIREAYQRKRLPIQQERDKAVAAHRKEKEDLRGQMAYKEQQKASLGFFKRKEKEALTRELEILNSRFDAMEAELAIDARYKAKLNAVSKEELAELQALEKEIRDANPMVSYEDFKMPE